jgi:hypothetical protein
MQECSPHLRIRNYRKITDKTNSNPKKKKVYLNRSLYCFEGVALTDETVFELVRISNLVFLFNKNSFCMM